MVVLMLRDIKILSGDAQRLKEAKEVEVNVKLEHIKNVRVLILRDVNLLL
jgi:hypothetical protein